MAGRPPSSGTRVIAVLGLLLLAALGFVAWIATRPEPAPPKEPTPSAQTRRDVVPPPRHERLNADFDRVPSIPDDRTKESERESREPRDDRELVKLDAEVLGVNGLAAPGAIVLLLDPFVRHGGPTRSPVLARVQADEKGHALFEVSERPLRVYASLGNEAGASERFVASEARSRVAVRMSAAVPLRGRVVESSGLPVAEAAVRFWAAPWLEDAFGLVLETTSAADGAFEFPPVASSAFETVVEAWVEARAKGWPTSRVAVTADAARAGEILVTLERGAFLRGRLVRPTGQAIRGEEVRLVDGRSSVVSDADGKFELPLPRAGGIALALAAVHGDSSNWTKRSDVAAKLLGRFRGDSGDFDVGDVVLTAGKPVRGVVVDLDDRPVKAGDVALYLAGVQVAKTQTDDAGKFELDGVGDDAHVLIAVAPPAAGAPPGDGRRAVVDGVRGDAPELRVVLTGALSVVLRFLTEADRTPIVVSEVKVTGEARGDTPSRFGWTMSWPRISSVRVPVEHAGLYDVTLEIPGYLPATFPGVEAYPDRENELNLLFREKP